MDGLHCENCRQTTAEFTILHCDHVVCAECLWSEVRTSLQGVNSISCPCGIATAFVADPKLSKEKPESKQAVSQLLTDVPSSSGRMITTNRSSLAQQQPKGELNTELQFLSVQFKKSIEEAERNFSRVVQVIKEKYDNLIKSIRMFWHQEMTDCQTFSLLNFPTILAKKYSQTVGESLQNLNQTLLESLSSFRLESRPFNRILSSSVSSLKSQNFIINKENRATINRQQQKGKLLKAIEDLKKRTENIRRMGRKERSFFNRV